MAATTSRRDSPSGDTQQYPLLETKLYIPPPRTNLVSRSWLIERLDEEIGHKLTLISAPAGFGKTTLLSEWIHQSEIPVAWVSLDKADSEPAPFFSYLIAALQTIEPNIGKAALTMLQSPQPPPIESIITKLINEIIAIQKDIALVLDDYHLIENQQIHDSVEFLLEHLPPQMHLIIVTRADPPLSLARLRGRNQLSEFRASDLRFTSNETFEFLNNVTKLGLSSMDIDMLESRTEGWVAGLQLAALSMQGSEDIPAFIKAFTGDDRHIVDYLTEEVLKLQTEQIQNFLLQTSILNRLSEQLCDFVIGQTGSQEILNFLERANLFIIPLDNKRHWYRYHHLFADLLKQQLQQNYGDLVPQLHVRASVWYEDNGLEIEAFHHALAAEDFERAAGLLELAWPAMEESYQSIAWLGWVKALPDELVRARPVLSVAYAIALMNTGELEAAEPRLLDAERWLELTADMDEGPEAPSAKMVVVDEEQFRSLPASIAFARAWHAQALGDLPGTVKYAQRVLDLSPEGDQIRRVQANALLGIALWASGDLEAAHLSVTDLITHMQEVGNISDAINLAFILVDIKMAQGRLHEALSTYQQWMQLATAQGEPMPLGVEELYRVISELHRERGDLEAAAQRLLTSKKLSERAESPDWQHRLCVAQARIKESQGDLKGALDLLEEAERQQIRNPLPDVRPIAALKTRIWVAQGRMAEALDWVRERSLSVDDELSYLREFEHITLARVLIAQHKSDLVDGSINDAKGLLERLLLAAEEGGRTGSVIDILVQQALAHEVQGDTPLALVSLERALTLAEPEGYVRVFVGEGQPMAELLEEALDAKIDVPRPYVKKLLTAYKVSSLPKPDGGLLNPLTEREAEVLQLMAARLSNKEIAQHLYISVNTVKTHVKKTISKLGADSRTKAVVVAKELGLL